MDECHLIEYLINVNLWWEIRFSLLYEFALTHYTSNNFRTKPTLSTYIDSLADISFLYLKRCNTCEKDVKILITISFNLLDIYCGQE